MTRQNTTTKVCLDTPSGRLHKPLAQPMGLADESVLPVVMAVRHKKWLPMRVQLSCSRVVLEESTKPRRGLKQLLCSDREVIPASFDGDDFDTVGEEKPK